MASFYQKATGRRRTNSAGRTEDIGNTPPIKDERSSHQRWASEPQDEPAEVVTLRSRSRTMNSAMSFYTTSNSDSSNAPSRAGSPHLTRDKAILAFERRDNTAKTLLSKGSRILRKHGSKFSLTSLYTMDGDTSDRYMGRPVTAQTASGPKDAHSSVEGIRREQLKRKISDPFDFQHVTHTDRVFLNSMQRVPKTELVGEFSALRAGQASKPQLRGIRVEDLPASKLVESAPTSLVIRSEADCEASLPQTPTRPTPPPKDALSPLSPVQCIQMSRSIDNFSRPTTLSTTSQVTPPRRYSSRRALQPSLSSPFGTLGAYTHTSSHHIGTRGSDSTEDLCANCKNVDLLADKPLPRLPSIHAVATDDESTVNVCLVPLPRNPLDLTSVHEEDETKRQSGTDHQFKAQTVTYSTINIDNSPTDSSVTRASIAQDDTTVSPYDQLFSVDDWDHAIDDSWDHAAEPEDTQCPSSLTAQVANFVDKAMTRFAESEQNKPSNVQQAIPTSQVSTRPSELKVSTRKLSDSSPVLGLGIEAHQSFEEVVEPLATSTPAVTSFACEGSERDSGLTDSFNSHCSAVSGISKSSSQESIIWSIASSIMGTQRSSNSSNSLLDHLPEYPGVSKSMDDLKDALESVQEHLQEIHEGQSDPTSSCLESSLPGKQSHQRAKSLAADFAFGTRPDNVHRRRPTISSCTSPQASYGHQRVPSGSRIPVPARKSSARDQPQLSNTPTRRMRSATTTSRSKHASRASYSLFPGASPIRA